MALAFKSHDPDLEQGCLEGTGAPEGPAVCGSWNIGEDKATASQRCFSEPGVSVEKHPCSSLSPTLQYFTSVPHWLKLAGNQGRLGNAAMETGKCSLWGSAPYSAEQRKGRMGNKSENE